MAKFFTCSNNSVTAVMTEKDYLKLQERYDLLRECERGRLPRPELPPVTPVFTFSDPDHPSFRFMTGSVETMRWLLEGHEVVHGGIWVPFSNGYEWDRDPTVAQHELEFCTSLDQAIEAFGLTKIPVEQA